MSLGTEIESLCSSYSSRSFESSLVSKPSIETSLNNSSSTLLYKFIDYNPFYHQNRSHLYPSYLSIVFVVYRSVGLGFLCMPHAFQQVGAVVGLALCVFAGLTFNYSYTLLCRFRYKICQIHRVPTTMPYYSYQNLIECSLALGPRIISNFSKFFKFMFVIMNLLLNFGTSCLYTKFVSTSLQELFAKIGLPMKLIDSCLVYIAIYLALLLIPSMKKFDNWKVFEKIILIASLLCYFYSHMYTTDIQIDHQSLFRGDWREVFYFIGILLFSFVPVVQLLKIEDELIKPEDFVRGPFFGLLRIAIAIVTNMYSSVGLWGYLAFDHLTKIEYSVLTVIPASSILNVVKIIFMKFIVLSHQELCSASVSLIWWSSIAMTVEEVKYNDKMMTNPRLLTPNWFSFSNESWLVASIKIVFTSGSFLVTAFFLMPSNNGSDYPERAMALLGYAGNAWNVLVYPFVIELCLTHALHGMSTRPYVIAKDVFFVVIGMAVSVVGVYAIVTRNSVAGDYNDDGI